MKVGHGSAALPVRDGTALGGYADRTGHASGVLDPLRIDCVSLAGPAGRLLIVVAEVLCINEDLAESVRAAVAAEVGSEDQALLDVWTCATHTHSGPDLGYVPGGGSTPSAWRLAISAAAAAAARAAVRAERSCAGSLHRGDLVEVGSVRSSEGGPASVPAEVVCCRAGDGRLVGLLAVVPIHPTVLPASSTVVSGDLLGAIRRSLQRRLADPDGPWVVVALGAAGDISTRRTRRAQTPAECRRLGELAAEQLAALADGPSAALWAPDDDGPLAARRTLRLSVREPDLAAIGALRSRFTADRERLLASGDTAAARTAETALQGIAVAEASTSGAAGPIGVTISAARLGRLALLGVGGEPFLSLGADLRARCGAETVVLGCTNGHVGYLPDDTASCGATYEALASPLAPGAAAVTAAALADLVPKPRRHQ